MDSSTSHDNQQEVPPGGARPKQDRSRWGPHLGYKILKSLALTEIWFYMGVTIAIITPTMVDLVELFNTNVEEVSRVLVAKSVGLLAGSVTLAALSDKYPRHVDVFLAVEVLVMGGSMAAVPWMPSVAAAGVLFCLSGIAWGGISSGGNGVILMMWGEKAAVPLQFIHNGFGLGTMITPLLVGPFLSNSSSHNGTNQSCDLYNDMSCTETGSPPHVQTRIFIPYGICGVLGVLGAGMMLAFYIYSRRLPNEMLGQRDTVNRTWLQLFNPRSCSDGRLGFGSAMVLGLFCLYVALVAKDSLGTYIQTYAVEALGFSKPTASTMTTTYFAGYTLGRYAGMLLALCLPLQLALFLESICELGVAVALVIWGTHSKVWFWVLSVAFGFFAGPMYPAAMAWADRYIEVTSLVVSVIDLGIGIGYMLASWLGGYLYTYVGKQYILYQVAAASALFVGILVVLQLVASAHGVRFHRDTETHSGQSEDRGEVDERSPLIN